MITHFKLSSLALALSIAFATPACAQQAPPPAVAAASSPDHVELPASNGRIIDVSVWPAADERGVIVFSHGHGGRPEAYERILSQWVADGFTVIAPLHVDSLAHPQRASFDNQSGFGTRVEDLAVVRGFAKATHPGMPLIAAGHSFGSLMSLISAGAVTAAGPQGDADIKAVVALSSAGDLPGLVTPEAYAGLTAPMLMITGDADLVSGYVTDWRAHRSPYDRSPSGDRMLIVYEGGDHSLVRDADAGDFDFMVEATTTFMQAYGRGDTAARARLDALTAPAGATLERR